MTFNKWDVWLAKVRYDDSMDIKIRPVLIIDTKLMTVFALKMTGQNPRANYSGEYSVIKWHEAGLDKQTVIRASKKLSLCDSDFVKRLGRLQVIDIVNIKSILQSIRE